MGIFDFLKKSKKIKEIEKVSQSGLQEWLLNKQKELDNKEGKLLNPIKERIYQLVSELKAQIAVLENIDINAKKVDSRVKLIVKENLKNYIGYLQRVIQKLNDINSGKDIVNKINLIFSEFDRKSKITYEKITFIVGKEMQATKDSIKKFFRDLEYVIKKHKKSLDEFKTIELIEIDTKKLSEIKENKSKILGALNEDIDKIKILEKNIENKEDEIEEIKKSEKYIRENKKKQELEVKNKELQRLTKELNKIINFKGLANFYHEFEKEMNLVKQYKEHFKKTLQRLKIDSLASLLKEAKLDNEEILELIEKINKANEEIKETIIEDTGILFLEKGIDKIKSEINTINSEKAIKEKKIKSIEEELEIIVESIKDKLEKVNVEFE